MSSVNIPAEDSTDERQEVIQVQILPQVGTTLASESYLHSYPCISLFYTRAFFCNAPPISVDIRGNNACEILVPQLFEFQGTPHVTSKFEPSRERFRPLASPRRDRRQPAGVSLVEILSAARALILPIVFEYKEAEDVDENPKFTKK